MSSEWRATTLGEVSTWASGGTPKKDEPTYWGGDIPWISANSMHATRFFESDLTLTEAGLKNGSRLASKDTVLLLVRGSALHSRMPVGIALRNLAFNQDVKAITAKTNQIRPWYLLYWLMGNEKFILDSVVEFTGIGAGKLDTKRMQGLDLLLPPLAVQDEILESVKSIDDRITLLRETNTTLEAIAQALFKSWFVDFDPVHAKMQGRPPEGMDEATAALFPDSFEESALGDVPKGWATGKLADIASLKGGKMLDKTSFSDSGANPVFGGAGVMGFSDLSNSEGFVITVGRVGAYCGQYFWHQGRAWVNNNASLVSPINPDDSCWLFLWLKNVDMDLIKKGAAQPFVSNGDISDLKIVLPPSLVVEKFVQLVEPIFQKLSLIREKTQSLEVLRDTLLPRLISGQILISGVQIEAKAA